MGHTLPHFAARLGSQAIGHAATAVLPAIRQAAARTGIDFSALMATARLESGLNPAAKAATSSATGLFQFIDSTWLSTLKRHAGRHGIHVGTKAEALELRKDPYVASLMAAEHMADNRAYLERGLGRQAGTTDLYLAHFLGAGGALKFLSAMQKDPSASGAQLFPSAAKANTAIFHGRGGPRSLADIHALFSRRLGDSGTNVPESRPVDGTNLPALLKARAAVTATDGPTPAPIDARLAARAAYLVLAELGG